MITQAGTLKVDEDGGIRIPAEMLEKAKLEDGGVVILRAADDGSVSMTVEERDPDQWWYWTEEWQKGEREVDEDRAAGRISPAMSGEEFIAALEAAHDRVA